MSIRRVLIWLTEWALCLMLLIAAGWWTWQYPPWAPSWLTVPEGYYHPKTTLSSVQKPLQPIPLGAVDTQLQTQLMAIIQALPPEFRVHLFYFNLHTHRYVAIHANEAVSAASVIKLPLMWLYLSRLNEGVWSPLMHWPYEPFEQTGGSGSLQLKPHRQPIPSVNVVRSMIQESDNSCTNMLIYYLGGMDLVNPQWRSLGLTQTQLRMWLPDLDGTNTISVAETAQLIYNLAETSRLSPWLNKLGLTILEGTHNRRLMAGKLPPDTLIAHKTGDIGTSLGDSGLVTLPNGQRYILTLQIERPFNRSEANDAIQQLSKTVYDALVITSPTVTITPRIGQ